MALREALPSSDAVPQCRVAAVIPAAGCGERMSHPTPKQYLKVCGQPLVVHCLRTLQEAPWVERIVLVADDLVRMEEALSRAHLPKVVVVQGGRSRHWSIRMGLESLDQDPPDVVLVHDGVRPLLPQEVLVQVVLCAERHGASGAFRPLVSTVLRPDEGGFLEESLARRNLCNSETPQAFRFQVLKQAYSRCMQEDMDNGTECLALALKYADVRAKLVPGTPQLWKVTEERDLEAAKVLLPRYTRRIAVVCHLLAGDCDEGEGDDGPPPPLSCDAECLQVFHALEGPLKGASRSVCFSPGLGGPSAEGSCCVVVISGLDEMRDFRGIVEGTALRMGPCVSRAIFVLTLKEGDCDLSLTQVTDLQRILRDSFRSSSVSATALIRRPAGAGSSRKATAGAAEGEEEGEEGGGGGVQMGDLIKSLMDQATGCFHGQVFFIL